MVPAGRQHDAGQRPRRTPGDHHESTLEFERAEEKHEHERRVYFLLVMCSMGAKLQSHRRRNRIYGGQRDLLPGETLSLHAALLLVSAAPSLSHSVYMMCIYCHDIQQECILTGDPSRYYEL